jgi:hypothetical protein
MTNQEQIDWHVAEAERHVAAADSTGKRRPDSAAIASAHATLACTTSARSRKRGRRTPSLLEWPTTAEVDWDMDSPLNREGYRG